MLKSYSDKRLHTQLLFFKTLFDVEWARSKVEADCKRRDLPLEAAATHLEADEAALFGALKQQVVSALEPSAFDTVDLKSLFRRLF